MFSLCLLLSLFLSAYANAANGLPTVEEAGIPPAALAFDLSTRTVVTMTDNETWCTFDGERQDWCGGNYTNPYLYCVFADQWPINDTVAWLSSENSSIIVSPFIWPGEASVCACQNPGAAYWIPEVVYPVPKFQPPCGTEHFMLAIYVLVGIIFFCLGWLCLLEIVMWFFLFVLKEKQCNILGGFLPKIFAFLTCLCIELNFIVILIGANSTPQWQYAQIFLWVFCAIFIILTYLWWLLAFTDVVIKTKNMERRTSPIIHVVKWSVICLVTGFLIGMMISLGVGYNYALKIENSNNYLYKQDVYNNYHTTRETNVVLACIALFLVFVWGAVMTAYSAFIIHKDLEANLSKQLQKKTWWNLIANISLLFILVMLIIYACYETWHLNDITEYQTQVGYMWIVVIQAFFASIMLFAVTMALKTNFKHGEGYCSTIFVSAKRTASQGRSQRSHAGSLKSTTLQE